MVGLLELKALSAYCAVIAAGVALSFADRHSFPDDPALTGIVTACTWAGRILLASCIIAEVYFTWQLSVITSEIEHQWKEQRQHFFSMCTESASVDITRPEIDSTRATHFLSFAFVEFQQFIQDAPPNLLDAAISPLIGFQPLALCPDSHLEALLASIITLNHPSCFAASEGTAISPEIISYISSCVHHIRRKIPKSIKAREGDGDSGNHLPAKRKGENGADFWDKRPDRWHFPWGATKLMELYEKYLYFQAKAAGLAVVNEDSDYPIYVRPTAGSAPRGMLIKDNEIPMIVFHGATCKFIAIYNNLMSKVPASTAVIAPLFTPLWFYGSLTATSHLATVDKYFEMLDAFLQAENIHTIHVAAWSLGCLLATGFIRRFGQKYTIAKQVYIEPLGSLASCCLTYACVCEPLASVREVFHTRGGSQFKALSFGFSLFMKNDALSRCYWKLLPFRNVFWGVKSFNLPNTKDTLVLLSEDDPITFSDAKYAMYSQKYFSKGVVLTRPGFHGMWTRAQDFSDILSSWITSSTIPPKSLKQPIE